MAVQAMGDKAVPAVGHQDLPGHRLVPAVAAHNPPEAVVETRLVERSVEAREGRMAPLAEAQDIVEEDSEGLVLVTLLAAAVEPDTTAVVAVFMVVVMAAAVQAMRQRPQQV